MKPYGLKKADRITCFKSNCWCGDHSSKYPKHIIHKDIKNRRLKKSARQKGRFGLQKDFISEESSIGTSS